MRFSPKSLSNKLFPCHPKKKLVGAIKSNRKMLITGLMFGGGMELAGTISKKSQASEASDGAQIINLSNYGPAIAKFDSVESTNPAWWHRPRHVFGIPMFIFAVLIVITCGFCWRRFMCLLSCCIPCFRCSPKTMDKHSHFDSTLSSPSCEAVDMEDAMERLDFNAKHPDTRDGSHYTDLAIQVQQTMKAISQSAAVRAKAAHDLQRNECDMIGISIKKTKFIYLKIVLYKILIH